MRSGFRAIDLKMTERALGKRTEKNGGVLAGWSLLLVRTDSVVSLYHDPRLRFIHLHRLLSARYLTLAAERLAALHVPHAVLSYLGIDTSAGMTP